MVSEAIAIYERVLKGERWPAMYLGTPTVADRSVEILRYVFFDKLGIKTFDEAKNALDKQFVQKHKLTKVIEGLERPVELLPDEYDFVLWELFPERRKGNRALTVKVYSDVLAGKRKNFPRGYFQDAKFGKQRAEICVRHLCKKVLHYSGEKIAKEFSHSNGIKTLSRYKLKIILNHVYLSLSDMMYQVYPQYCDKLEYYQHLQDGRYHRKKRSDTNGSCKRIRNAPGKKI